MKQAMQPPRILISCLMLFLFVSGGQENVLAYEVTFEGIIFSTQVFPFSQAEKNKILDALPLLEKTLLDLITQLETQIAVFEATGICDELKMAARLEMLRNIFKAMVEAIRSDEVLEIYRDDLGVGVQAESGVFPAPIIPERYVTFSDDYTPVRNRWTNASGLEFRRLFGHEIFHLEGDKYLAENDPFGRETLENDTNGAILNAHRIDTLFDGTEIANWSMINNRKTISWNDHPSEFAVLCIGLTPPTPGTGTSCLQNSLNKPITVDALSLVEDPDDDVLTLPEAISRANLQPGLDVIEFASKLAGRTLVATGISWAITDSVVLKGNDVIIVGNEFRVSGLGIEVTFEDLALVHVKDATLPTLSGIRATPDGPTSPGTRPVKVCLHDMTITGKTGVAVSNTFGEIYVEDTLISENVMGGVWSFGTVVVKKSAFRDNLGIAVMNTASALPAVTWVSYTEMTDNKGGVMVFPSSAHAASNTRIEHTDIIVSQSGLSPTYTTNGIFIKDSDILIENVKVSGHYLAGSEAPGAGIFMDSSLPEHVAIIRHSVIEFNFKTNLDPDGSPSANKGGPTGGGGIFSRMPLAIEKSVISYNESFASPTGGEGRGGGGINFLARDILLIEDSEISLNTSQHEGGGINVGRDATLIMRNTTVSGNASEGSGAGLMAASAASVSLTNNTFYLNNSNHEGGAPSGYGVVLLGALGSYHLANNIVYGSTNDSISLSQDLAVSGAYSGGHNLIGGVAVGMVTLDTDIIGVDPELAPLDKNGADTAHHVPLPGSPVINAGDNALATSLVTDQIGAARIMDGTIEIGSIEVSGGGGSPSPPVPPSPPIDELTIEQALDANGDDQLDDPEIQTAIQHWISGEEVPGTSQTIDDQKIIELIQLWIQGGSVS